MSLSSHYEWEIFKSLYTECIKIKYPLLPILLVLRQTISKI